MIKAIAIDDEPLALKALEILCDKVEFISLERSFTRPKEAVKYLNKQPVDLVFVDVQMPSITGLKLVESFNQDSMVVFTTAYSEYAATSYDLNAIDYLLKPIGLKRFELSMNRAKEHFNLRKKRLNEESSTIHVRSDFSLVQIVLSEILYIENLGDYLTIFIQDRKPVVTRMPMKEMIGKLPEKEFLRVHRSFIIRLSRIQSVRENSIQIPECKIPIGKTYIKEFRKRFPLKN